MRRQDEERFEEREQQHDDHHDRQRSPELPRLPRDEEQRNERYDVGQDAEDDGAPTSLVPSIAACTGSIPCWRFSKTFSPTTTASSTTMPSTIKKPKSEIMFTLTSTAGQEEDPPDERDRHPGHDPEGQLELEEQRQDQEHDRDRETAVLEHERQPTAEVLGVVVIDTPLHARRERRLRLLHDLVDASAMSSGD
jgi:hypothetical protein